MPTFEASRVNSSLTPSSGESTFLRYDYLTFVIKLKDLVFSLSSPSVFVNNDVRFSHAARLNSLGAATCSFGGFNHTSPTGFQSRVWRPSGMDCFAAS